MATMGRLLMSGYDYIAAWLGREVTHHRRLQVNDGETTAMRSAGLVAQGRFQDDA